MEHPLRTIVLGLGVPAPVLASWREAFPEIDFRGQVDGPDADGRFRIEQGAPDGDAWRVADAWIGWELGQELLEAAPRLRWVHAASAGVDHFDLAALAARGIVLTNSRGVHAPNIAEHVLAMMLALARRLPRLMRAQAAREWRDHATHAEVTELQGQRVLIVGTGEIGRAIAARATAFGLRVAGLRREVGRDVPEGFAEVADMGGLARLLADADHVIVALPDTPRTRGLIDAAAFAAMKPGAIIYNVGRGPVIDTAAMIAALQSGRLGGAGLDVTDPEPLPPESPLWSMENVLITAHTSGATPRFWERQGALIAESIGRIQRGEPPWNIVDLAAGY